MQLYPEGVGFRYETGGRLADIRALTPDRIREFHRDMYQPRNLCLVLTGTINHANLLDILENFENTVIGDVAKPNGPFRRPWIDSQEAPPLAKSAIERIQFPEEDESFGEVSVHFFGPNLLDSLLCNAMSTLLMYLAGSSASILNNVIVEKEHLANNIAFNTEYRPKTVVQFFLSGVSTKKLELVEERFFEIIRGAAANPIDLGYIRDCIKRERRRVKFYAESSTEYFSEVIIKDFLFGRRDGSTLQSELETLNDFDTLETWDDGQWRHWLTLWLAEGPHATILAEPSARLSKKLASKEKARVESRKKQLGAEGLKRLEEQLAIAKVDNDEEVPKKLLESFNVPSTESIRFIHTATARSGTARVMGSLVNPIQETIDKDSDLSLFIHFEHVQSNFAYVTLVLGTEVVPLALRPLLSLYVENFFTSPMVRESQIIDFADVVMELERDTVGYEIDSGQRLGNSEIIAIKLIVEIEKYHTAIQWLRNLLCASVFDVDRLIATTTKILAGISAEKRDGDEMVREVELMTSTAPSSIGRASSTLTRALYLKRVRHLLGSDPTVIIEQLKEVNTALFQVANLRVLVIADIQRLEHPVSSWSTLIEGLETDKSIQPLDSRLSRLSDQGRSPGSTAFVVPLPSIDSSFAGMISKAPSSYKDPAYPTLMVAVAYLNAIEGPLWGAVRGSGLAYSCYICQNIEAGQISLAIYMSPDAHKAFLAAKKVVQNFVSGKTEFDQLAVEGATSSIVLNFANADATMESAAQSSFVRQVMRGLPKDWPSSILEKVRKVKPIEIQDAIRNVILPIFDPRTADLFVTCAPIMEKKVVTGFEESGFAPVVKPLAFFQDDYGLKAGENVLEEEEDDDDLDDSMEEDESGGEDEEEEDDDMEDVESD